MIPQLCAEKRLNESGFPRRCCRPADHDGDHLDEHGGAWAPPEKTLPKLHARWGRTHHVAWTGRLWLATHRNPDTHWRTEVEPTPELLEDSLRRHHGDPPGPPVDYAPRSERTPRVRT